MTATVKANWMAYIDVDILVSCIFQTQCHKLIGRCKDFGFIDVLVKIEAQLKISQSE